MPLREGFTRFRGVIMNVVEADHVKRLNQRLKRHIDARHPDEARQVLTEMKDFAGDHEEYRKVFEILRAEASERWHYNFGTSWKSEFTAKRKE